MHRSLAKCFDLRHARLLSIKCNLSSQVSQRYSGTVTHMPPELIEDGKVYQQGDVYAFGIMMWEVSQCARLSSSVRVYSKQQHLLTPSNLALLCAMQQFPVCFQFLAFVQLPL